MQLFIEGPVVSCVPRQLFAVLYGVRVFAFAPLEARAAAGVRVPAGGPAPLGLLTLLPGKRPGIEGKSDDGTVRSHRRTRPGHQVIRVNDDWRVPACSTDGGLQLAQPLHPDRVNGHRWKQGVVGRRDFLRAAQEERMPSLS